jgi:hypothetical protein
MRFSRLGPFLGVATTIAIGCGDKLTTYPPPKGCNMDAGPCPMSSGAGIGSGAGTGTGGGTTTTGSGGEVPLGTLTGTVVRMLDPTFVSANGPKITSLASIVIQPATGPQIVAPYGGTNGTTFTATNVPAGLAWVEVRDESQGGAGIWSTITALTMPQISSVTLPVVDEGTLTNLASNLPNVGAKGPLSTQASHVVLMFRFNGTPYKGLQVTGGTNGAVIVYDTGPGNYSDQTMATGTAGTVILFDSGLTGPATISLTDPTMMKTYQVTAMTAQGAVTLAAFDLP